MDTQQPNIHVGKLIQATLKQQGRSVTWFSEQLCCSRTNIYLIYKKKYVDIELLVRISKVLNINFFQYIANEIAKELS